MGCFGVFFTTEVELSSGFRSLHGSEFILRSILRAKRRRFSFGGRDTWSLRPTHPKNNGYRFPHKNAKMSCFGVFFTTGVELSSSFSSLQASAFTFDPSWEPSDWGSGLELEIVDLCGRHTTKMMIMGSFTRKAEMGCFGVFSTTEVELSSSFWSLQASEFTFRSILRAKRRWFSFGGRDS